MAIDSWLDFLGYSKARDSRAEDAPWLALMAGPRRQPAGGGEAPWLDFMARRIAGVGATPKGATGRPSKPLGDPVPLAPGTPGATVSLDDIKTAALQTGLGEEGARVAMAIARTEGGLTGNVGDNGNSYGVYQFHRQGMLPSYATSLGLDVPAAGEYARQHPLEAATWALSGYLGKAIKDGMAQGLRGPALATYAQRVGQRSQNPERAGTVYASMFK